MMKSCYKDGGPNGKGKKLRGIHRELETIVSSLEKGELELDEALKLFDRGIKLSKSCQDILDKAEQKVTVLTREEDRLHFRRTT